MLRILLSLFLGILFYSNSFAQITPPGLGKVNTASWFALGVKQNLNQKETTTSTTFIGVGRISDPDDYNLIKKPSIYVVNEEVTHRFKENWKYSFALSYRWQNEYKKTEPYHLDTPDVRKEIRYYNRFTYLKKFKNIDFSLTYRPELRFFFDPNFDSAAEKMQFRSRISGKTAFNINELKTQKIITSVELLFATSKTENWSPFEYKETRFSLYYSLGIPKQKITLNVGYMNNLIGKSKLKDAHYLAFDVVIKNPFGKI